MRQLLAIEAVEEVERLVRTGGQATSKACTECLASFGKVLLLNSSLNSVSIKRTPLEHLELQMFQHRKLWESLTSKHICFLHPFGKNSPHILLSAENSQTSTFYPNNHFGYKEIQPMRGLRSLCANLPIRVQLLGLLG